jgi:hypothetical protein
MSGGLPLPPLEDEDTNVDEGDEDKKVENDGEEGELEIPWLGGGKKKEERGDEERDVVRRLKKIRKISLRQKVQIIGILLKQNGSLETKMAYLIN